MTDRPRTRITQDQKESVYRPFLNDTPEGRAHMREWNRRIDETYQIDLDRKRERQRIYSEEIKAKARARAEREQGGRE